jgi:hypothetical protein
MIYIRIDGEYLEFADSITVERRVKLFEDISKSAGDFSYSFDMARSQKNMRLLRIPVPDNSRKQVYSAVPCELVNAAGEALFTGSIRVDWLDYQITCSFFSGNNNWYGMLTGNMTDLDLSDYDTEQTEFNITNSWFNTEGIVYPLIDTGKLLDRSSANMKVEDYVGCFYLHTLLREVFNQSGLKVRGELFDNVFFKRIIVATNTRSKVDIDNNSLYAANTTPFVINALTPATVQSLPVVTTPYYQGETVDYNGSTFTAPYPMIVDIDISAVRTSVANNLQINIRTKQGGVAVPNSDYAKYGGSVALKMTGSIKNWYLDTGDQVEFIAFNLGANSVTITKLEMKVTPRFIYRSTGTSSVPLWTKQEFVSNVLQEFNIVPAYDQYTKTVTLNFFDRIKSKTPIDLSQHVTVDRVDYIDMVSNYAKSNTFSYKETNDDFVKEYNISTFLKYGSGVITVENDFIQDTVPVISSKFAAPVSYLKFGMSLEKVDYVETEDVFDEDITNVTNSGGTPRFNISNDVFIPGDLVRITESSQEGYNGEWIVSTVASGYFTLRGLSYLGDATAKATKLAFNVTTSDNVYLFVFTGLQTISDCSDLSTYFLEGTELSSIGFSYFNLLRLGRTIESKFDQGLSFGRISDPLFYQKTILETFWAQFQRILNDPVKLIGRGYLPVTVYKRLDFLQPVYIKTLETSNLYYINRIGGYEDQSTACDIELIKLP